MNKVLFITYYWHPSGKASLHWPLKIIKHLPKFGWQPIVLTVDEDTFSQKDYSFENDISPDLNVIHVKSYEPFNIYKKFTGKKSDNNLVASETISKSNKSLAHKISIWIRMNLFIPDARVGWYFPAVKSAKKFLRKDRVEAIVSVGPPHTTHLIGKKLSGKYDIPHLPVFIDPWVDIAYYKDFKRTIITKLIDNHFEKSVMKYAKSIIFVTETMKRDYITKYDFINDKSHVLHWGYSEEEFEKTLVNKSVREYKQIVHAGNIFSYQNPVKFWVQVKREIDNGNPINIKFVGTVDPDIKKSISEAGLDDYTEYTGFISYNKMLKTICEADILLVCATEPRHVPGKLFEYLRTGKPVIAFGDNNIEVKQILEDSNAGMMFSYENSGEEFFRNYQTLKSNPALVIKFERTKIAESFGKVLNKL